MVGCVLGGIHAHGTIVTAPSATCSSCDGEATFATGLGGLVLYEWYNNLGMLVFSEQQADGTSVITNLCPGVYSVQATNGIQNEFEFFNISTSAVNAGEWSEFTTCEDGVAVNLFDQLAGAPQPGGTWIAPDGTVHTGLFDPTVDSPGIYFYELDGGGCTVTNGIEVTVNQNADPGLSTTYLICETYGPFLLTNVLAGAPDPGGQWLLPDQTPFDGIYDTNIHDSGSYFYLIDTVPGCSQVISVLTIIENTLPNAGESNTIYICPNAPPFDMTSQLGGNPELTGNWTNNINQSVSNIFDPAVDPEGTYTYTVPAATPCTAQESELTIVFTAGISAGEGSTVTACATDNPIDLYTQLGGNPTPDGTWYDPNGNVVDPNVSPQDALPGTYTYQVSAVGCPDEASAILLQIESVPNAGTGGEMFICDAASPFMLTDLNSDDADDFGMWTDENLNILQDPFLPVTNETYVLTYTVDNAICPSDEAVYTIHIDEAPPVPQDVTLQVCENSDPQDLAEVVTEPNSFSTEWTFNNVILTSSMFDPEMDAEGVYVYTILSNNSCPDQSANVSIALLEEAFESEYQAVEVCYSEPEVNLQSYFNGIDWSLGEWMYELQPTPPIFPVNLDIGGIYTYEVENDPQCPASILQLEITVVTVPDAGEDGTILWCESIEGLDLTDGLSGASSLDGTWFLDGSEIDPIIDATPTSNGIYTYFLEAIGPCPADEAEVEVVIEEAITFNLGEDIEVCANTETINIAVENIPPYGYSWILDEELQSDPGIEFSLLPTNDGQLPAESELILIASDGVCTAYDTILITVNPLPQPVISGPNAVCVGELGNWIVEGGESVEWQSNVSMSNPASPFQELVVDQELNLNVTATNEYGCESTASLEVTPMPLPNVFFEASPVTGCTPLEATLINLSQNEFTTSYYWLVDGIDVYDDDSPIITLTEEGFHHVELIATSEFGCTNSFFQENYLQAYALPQSSWDYSPNPISELNTNVEFEDMSNGASTYMWEFGDLAISEEQSPVFQFPEVGGIGYQVCETVWSEHGCMDQSCHDLFIQGEFWVFAPNAFTPDNDGLNEVFYPVCNGYDPSGYHLQIFDRWGALVFESIDPTEVWIGNVQGQSHYAPNGVYVWQLEVKSLYKAEIQQFSGFVTLFR